MMTIQENTSVFDLSIQLNGELNSIVKNILTKYSINSFDEDLTNKIINEEYSTNSQIVNNFFINSENIVTSEPMSEQFDNVIYSEFNLAFNRDYDSLNYPY
jgi:hypothetical protein